MTTKKSPVGKVAVPGFIHSSTRIGVDSRVSSDDGAPPAMPSSGGMVSRKTTPSHHKIRVYGYSRYSSPTQHATSIERQDDAINDYARRTGLSVERIFSDYALSGASSDRPQLDELLDACRANPGSIVVVENLDRLIRSMPEYARILVELECCDAVIHDMTGRNSTVLEAIKAAIASEERIKILDRSALGRIRAAKAGRWVTSKPPYGYFKAAPGRIEVDPNTAPNVVTIFELSAKGFNCRQIACELDERGIAPPESDRWNKVTVKLILRNEIYLGWAVWYLTRPAGHL